MIVSKTHTQPYNTSTSTLSLTGNGHRPSRPTDRSTAAAGGGALLLTPRPLLVYRCCSLCAVCCRRRFRLSPFKARSPSYRRYL